MAQLTEKANQAKERLEDIASRFDTVLASSDRRFLEEKIAKIKQAIVKGTLSREDWVLREDDKRVVERIEEHAEYCAESLSRRYRIGTEFLEKGEVAIRASGLLRSTFAPESDKSFLEGISRYHATTQPLSALQIVKLERIASTINERTAMFNDGVIFLDPAYSEETADYASRVINFALHGKRKSARPTYADVNHFRNMHIDPEGKLNFALLRVHLREVSTPNLLPKYENALQKLDNYLYFLKPEEHNIGFWYATLKTPKKGKI